jgi:hypothetical protein
MRFQGDHIAWQSPAGKRLDAFARSLPPQSDAGGSVRPYLCQSCLKPLLSAHLARLPAIFLAFKMALSQGFCLVQS